MVKENSHWLSVLVFRLSDEWFAIPMYCLKEILESRPIHRIPHHKEKILLGVINLSGELALCVSFKHLLGIPSLSKEDQIKEKYKMIVIGQEEETWVFPVDEIEGIQTWNLTLLSPSALKVEPSLTSQDSKGVMNRNGKMIHLLDEEPLFARMRKGVSYVG